MIVPGLELLKEWVFDVATGVNVQLANVPRSVGVAAPPAVGYFDELTHEWVAQDLVDRDALIDPGPGPTTGNPRGALILRHVPGEGGFASQLLPEFLAEDPTVVPFGLLFVARKLQAKATPANYQTLKRNAYDTIRTAHRILAQKFDSSHSSYTKNDCDLMLARSGLLINGQFIEVGDDAVYGSLIIPLTATDRWALGIT